MEISIHALLAESDCIIDIINNIIDDFYPRSPCGERRGSQPLCARPTRISIHALLAESDTSRTKTIPAEVSNFYPRSPCGERPFRVLLPLVRPYFYPRSPCGERLTHQQGIKGRQHISIHALLAESDVVTMDGKTHEIDFYPRSPCGERRRHKTMGSRATKNFYPRSPCGERPAG